MQYGFIFENKSQWDKAPQEIVKLMRDGIVTWEAGLRVVRKGNVLRESGKARVRVATDIASGRFKYSELFCGIGGFRVGLDALGGQAVFASEKDKEAQVKQSSSSRMMAF